MCRMGFLGYREGELNENKFRKVIGNRKVWLAVSSPGSSGVGIICNFRFSGVSFLGLRSSVYFFFHFSKFYSSIVDLQCDNF